MLQVSGNAYRKRERDAVPELIRLPDLEVRIIAKDLQHVYAS